MDVREKLVELIGRCAVEESITIEPVAESRLVAFLVNHGVTVQEWISVGDKLPPYNHDVLVYRPNMAMKILVDNYAGYYGEDDDEWHEGWTKYGKDIHGKPIITYWTYLPQLPKGE